MNPAFGVVVPDDTTTLLLRACVLDGDGARLASEAWSKRVGDPIAGLRSGRWDPRAILPLLYANLRRNGCEPDDPAFHAHLRAAGERERLRSESHRAVMSLVLDALASCGHTTRLVGAAVLAETVYAVPELRHSFGVQLLVYEDEFPAIARTLRTVADPAPDTSSVFLHQTRVPITLQTHITPEWYRGREPDAAYATVEVDVLGHRCKVLPAELTVAHLCAQAFCSGAVAGDLAWITDAWFAFAAADSFHWDTFVDAVEERAWSIPVATTLSYLSGGIGLPVPRDVLATLAAAAGGASRTERDVAMEFAWRAASRRVAESRRGGIPPRSAWSFVRWRVAPSPGYLRATRTIDGPRDLAFAYARRPITFLRRRAGSFRRTRNAT